MCRIRAHSLCETTAWQRHVKRSACSASRSFCIGACCHSSAWPAEFHPSHTPSETKPTKEKYMRSECGRGSRASFWLLDSIPHRYMTVLVMPEVGNASRRFFPAVTPKFPALGESASSARPLLASKTCTRAWPCSPRPKKPGALLSRGLSRLSVRAWHIRPPHLELRSSRLSQLGRVLPWHNMLATWAHKAWLFSVPHGFTCAIRAECAMICCWR